MTILNEFESKQFLKEYGINIPKGEIAKIDNIFNDANKIRDNIRAYRYVLKIVSKDIVHKSDVSGVVLNVPPNQLVFECGTMLDKIKNKFPNVEIEGIYIQEMVEPGIECIIGIKEDPQFEKVIIFGLGGIYTEVFKDISMRILPISIYDVEEMMTETKIYKILRGYRGKKYDIDGIVNTIMNVSQLAIDKNVMELDINPLIVHEKDVIALDARIML